MFMKKFTKTLFLVVSIVSFKAEAGLPLAFAAARGAFKASIFALRHGVPVIKEVAVKARPAFQQAQNFIKTNPVIKEHAEKVRVFVKENPREAAYIGGGAALGYYTSGDGVVNTVVGTGLGAAAGAYGTGLHTAHTVRLGLQTELAVAGQRIEMLAYEGQALRSQLEVAQKGCAAALEKLKHAAAKPVAEKVCLGVRNVPSNPSIVEQAKNVWNLWRLPKPSVSPDTALQVLVNAAR